MTNMFANRETDLVAELPEDVRLALAAITIKTRIDIINKDAVYSEQVLAADFIRFAPSVETLTLGLAEHPFVVICAKKFLFVGGDHQVRIGPAAPHKPTTASQGGGGAPGADGTHQNENYDGKTGAVGGQGAQGIAAPGLPALVFLADEIEFLAEPLPHLPPVLLDGHGVTGGTGGKGGLGGPGGRGTQGIKGHSEIWTDYGYL